MLPSPDLGTGDLILYGVAVFVAAYVRGYAGFGLSAILLAAMTLRLPPAAVVPLTILMEIFASIGQGRKVLHVVDWRLLGALVAGGFIANPIGVQLLRYGDPELMRLVALTILGGASLMMMLGKSLSIRPTLPAAFGVGLLAGIVTGALSIGGMVIALFFVAAGTKAETIRATFIAFFFFTCIWVSVFMVQAGLMTTVTLSRALIAMPVLALGLWLGGNRFHGTSPESFRSFALGLLLVLCGAGIVKTIL